jgi:hypothetical protein
MRGLQTSVSVPVGNRGCDDYGVYQIVKAVFAVNVGAGDGRAVT